MTFTNPDKKPWRDLTDAEKGAVLLAIHEGGEIEKLTHDTFGVWPYESRSEWVPCKPAVGEADVIRVKPEPVVEFHKIPISKDGFVYDPTRHTGIPAYEITYQKRDGKPDFASVRMQEA